ncbi:DNA damage-inducible protein D [Candidatus Woesearchaeota archaeon]|nr:DNA damage-inducible protein D [Candidatus Woesearchaeota archaeon]
MKKSLITTLHQSFEDYAHQEDEVEFWFARDMQILLGYTKWENFQLVIEKAKESCKNSQQIIKDHFPEVRKTIAMPKGATKEIEDYKLTRYACYLIAQNGDPRKEQIAFAQSYFAIQTRKQELIEQRIALQERLEARTKLVASETELSKLIYERGVDDDGFARIRSKGDEALFGGFTTAQMKNKLRIPKNRPLADFLPTVTITAKNLATEITNFNVKKEDLDGENTITDEHVKSNQRVRGILVDSGIIPEKLPPEEDIQKLQRKVKSEEKTIADNSKRKIQKRLR